MTLLLSLSAPVLLSLACNSGAPVIVQLMPNSTQTLEPGKSVVISATLSNDTARKGVSWKLAGDGALVARTTTSVMYQAPSKIGAGTDVTVTAIANANSSKAASLSIILAPPNRTASENKDQRQKTAEGVWE